MARQAGRLGGNERSLVVARTLESSTQLWEVSLDGHTKRQIIHDEGPDSAPAVSPDGKFLAYTRSTDDFIPALSEGGSKRPLTQEEVEVFYPRPIDNETA